MPLLEAPRRTIDVERGPNWLFVRLHADRLDDVEDVADSTWQAMQQHFATRLVLELDEVKRLHSTLIGQLVRLHKRICSCGGMMRICGLGNQNETALHIARLSDRFPCYRNREDAVMGQRPAQPR